MSPSLVDQLLAVDAALTAAGVPHAFGGAIALAYWTLEPRGTRDLDVNVFVPADDAAAVLDVLPAGVNVPEGTAATIAREGQVRLWWDETPVDLFFDYAAVHDDARRHLERVPFQDREIPVLGPVELAAFKAMFDRTKDWADIEAILAAGTATPAAIRARLRPMLDDADPRLARLDEAARRASGR